ARLQARRAPVIKEARRRPAKPETRRQSGFQNFAFATGEGAPRREMRSGVLREARSARARPRTAPMSAGTASSFGVLLDRTVLDHAVLHRFVLSQHLPQA